jgi:hypothetical protein
LAIALLVQVLVFGGTGTALAKPFRIVVLPDSQNAVDKFPEVFNATCDWVAGNRKKLDIAYVLHVGDLVDRGTDPRMWDNLDAGLSRLEKGGVPYILAVGNHDYGRLPGGTNRLELFDRHFPVSRFEKLRGFGGHAPAGSNANSYHAFRAGGVNWLVVSLEFNAADYLLDWANQVVAAHPNHSVIVLTHSYLEHKGRDVSGERYWNKLVRHHANISMVVCGHLSTVNYVDKGDKGNTVYQMLFDWQNPTSAEMNSYCAILECDPEAGSIVVKVYSAQLDKYLTGGRGGFRYDNVEFMKRRPAKLVKIPAPAAVPQAVPGK